MEFWLLFILMPLVLSASGPEATIIDTGSTNRPGLRVTFDREGHATVARREEVWHIQLPDHLCNRFMRDVNAAEPLHDLPTRHCMKSASFGSSMFIEFNGARTRDLSCSPQPDARAAALQKDANEILQQARKH